MQNHSAMSHDMQACIDACTKCHQVCLQTALTHCIDAGGAHVEPSHFRLMMNCAELCQASANLQLSRSIFSAQLCALCAQVCDACALSCEQTGGMQACVQVCRDCAQSCRSMSGAQH
jgi:hypothetical protein